MKYTIEGSGGAGAASDVPYLGYSVSTLRQMDKAGYKLLIDGRRAKLPTETELRAAQSKELKQLSTAP